MVIWSQTCPGLKGTFYRLLTVGVTDISEPALKLDAKIGISCQWSHSVGVSPARLRRIHLRIRESQSLVGNVLMPIIFIMSAVVSE